MCYASKFRTRDGENSLSIDAIRSIERQGYELGVVSYCISGGEPSLRKDIQDVVRVLRPDRNIVALVTNTLLLNEEFVRDFEQSGLANFILSLDGPTPEVNDPIRGYAGHFQSVMNTIEWAKKYNIIPTLSSVVHHGNFDIIEEIVKLAKSLGITLVLSPVCIAGNWAGKEEHRLTKQDWEHILEIFREFSFVRSDFMINYNFKINCPGGREKICVCVNGEVTTCPMNFLSHGSIHEEPLADIVHRMAEFKHYAKKSPFCLIAADESYIEEYLDPIVKNSDTYPVRIEKVKKGKVM